MQYCCDHMVYVTLPHSAKKKKISLCIFFFSPFGKREGIFFGLPFVRKRVVGLQNIDPIHIKIELAQVNHAYIGEMLTITHTHTDTHIYIII